MMENENNLCAKKKIQPWLIGLAIIILCTGVYLIFVARKKQDNKTLDQTKALVTHSNVLLNTNQIIEMVKPGVVGIRIPGAKPFLQALQQNAVPEILDAYCPNCMSVVTKAPGVDWSTVSCPVCRTVMNGVITGTPVAQVAPAGAALDNVQVANCAKCGTQVTKQEGILWSDVTCPNCGITMANCVIAPSATPQAMVQGVNPAQGNLSANCPNCGVLVTKDPGTPWTMIYCTNCGKPMTTGPGVGLGNNAGTISQHCPKCNTLVTRRPGTPWSIVSCPNCGTSMFCPAVPVAMQQGVDQQALLDQQAAQVPQGTQQAWNPFAPAATPAPQASNAQFTKTEFLECPNCKITIEPKVGIPMSNAKCPSCGTTMAHVIRETQVVQNANAATQVAMVPNQDFLANPVQNGLQGGTNAELPILPVLHPVLHGAANLSPRNSLPTHVQPDLNNAAGHLSPRHLIPVVGGQPVAVPQPGQAVQPGTNMGPGMIQQATSGIGTGIIVSAKGYILTSSHLVAGYKTVEVVIFTPRGPKAVPGQVVSEATKMDLALIQIDPATVEVPLTALTMADSSTVRVGDQILAMGNPFGLTQSVSSGIVSSIREKINIQGHILYNVIQTDASINDGNSGGPLINTAGEVIGVNVAVYSPAQTYTGLGFAIPINQAKNSFGIYMNQNQANGVSATPKAFQVATKIGAVPRAIGIQPPAQTVINTPAQAQGAAAPVVETNPPPTVWFGIGVQKFNDILSETLKIPVDEGMLVNNIYDKSPADLAGLKRGDVIIRIDRKSITNEAALKTYLLTKKAGDRINVDIRRERIKKTLSVKLESGDILVQAMKQSATVDLLKGSEIETGTADIVPLGLTLDNITPDNAFASKLPQGTTGVLVSAVEGISFLAGVEEGDILRGVNGASTPTLLSVFKALKACNLTEGVVLNIERKGVRVDATLRESSKNIPGVV